MFQDTKQYKSALNKFQKAQEGLLSSGQPLAMFCVFHACQHNNVEPINQLLSVLTKPGKTEKYKDAKDVEQVRQLYKYVSNDAKRMLQFIADFAPVTINPERGTAKYVPSRADKGVVWRGSEDAYPLWYEWARADAPKPIEEQDGIAIITATMGALLKKIKDGKIVVSPASRGAFDAIIGGIDDVVKQQKAALSKSIDADLQSTGGVAAAV